MARIEVKVQPSSVKQAIKKHGDKYKIYLNSAPEKNKANRELVEYLSAQLKISKNNIIIIRGQTSGSKVLEITGITLADIEALLEKQN